jgi:hypothetical protein
MGTKIRWEQNAMIAAAHLSSDDGGKAFIFCSIPGGRPMFQFSRDDRAAMPIEGAPECMNVKQFRAFVTERFGGKQ